MDSNSPDSGLYIFNRNYRSSIRLNYQHSLFTNLAGNQLLHQAIRDEIDLSGSLRVADIGAGTAIWSIELAETLPVETNCHIDGFDISAAQYPPTAWVPSTVSLHQHDAFQPFPAEHQGIYDIVNVRFFITLLSKDKLQAFLQNVMSLLKPGGFFQWLDLDPRSVRPMATESSSVKVRTQSVANLMQGVPADVTSWLTDSCDMIQSAGFEPVTYDRLHLKASQRPLWNHCLLMGMEELCATLEANKTATVQAQALRLSLQELSGEFENGATVDAQWFYLVGRRPLQL